MSNQRQLVDLDRDSEILIKENPNSVMFGYIECTIDSFQLLSNGSIRIYFFCVPTTPIRVYYHILIPVNEIIEWLYCFSLEFSAIFIRLNMKSVNRLNVLLNLINLSDGFSIDLNIGKRYVIFVLNGGFDHNKYKRFLDILAQNDVSITIIDDYEGMYRFQCAQQKKNFKSDLAANSSGFSDCEILSFDDILRAKNKICGDSQQNSKDIKLFEKLSKFSTQPKRVMFGTFECEILTLEINILESITFVGVQQNPGFETQKERVNVTIPSNDVLVLKICFEQQMPAIFLKLRQDSAKAIQSCLGLKKDSNNRFVFDTNSEVQTEQFVKVVFNEFRALQLIACTLNPKIFNDLIVEEMTQFAALTLLVSAKHCGELKDNCTSPSGAANYGIHVLGKADVLSGIAGAVEADHKPAKEMTEQ